MPERCLCSNQTKSDGQGKLPKTNHGFVVLILTIRQRAEYAIRNRENQRRSRTKQKEYITSLEARVRKFEKSGADITTEVQIAARKVAEENHVLRTLLRKLGVSTAEIDDHLAGTRQVSDQGSKQLSTGNNLNERPFEQSRPYAPSDKFPAVRVRLQETALRPQEDFWRGCNPAPGVVTSTASSQTLQGSCLPYPTSDETSCENAARIIASMRGYEDPQALRPELGCTETSTCMVKNMVVFQLADR